MSSDEVPVDEIQDQAPEPKQDPEQESPEREQPQGSNDEQPQEPVADPEPPKYQKPKRRIKAPKPKPLPAQPAEIEHESEDEDTRKRRELEERLDAALKPNAKRRKIAGDDLEALQDDRIALVRKQMRDAAYKDVEAIRQGEPALNKIKMLPEVTNVLNKHSLADSVLDGNLLESVRIWLEPLPDASLPSYEIQKELFSALEKLPIKTLHLRESGLGQVVLFYQKSKRPHPTIKRTAEKLVGNWMRPIMGRSDDYRDKQVSTASYNPLEGLMAKNGARREAKSLAEDMAERRNRAAIPSARGETYQVAPMNMSAEKLAGKPNDSQLRRMKNKLAASNRGTKKSTKVSIEGRGLH